MKRYATVEKNVGETPLEATERLREKLKLDANVSLAYAGRLDPMASGKLLVLIGEECKKQTDYHSLDKEYEFQVLFGIHSDTADVLGIVSGANTITIDPNDIATVAKDLVGLIELPYPHYSAKTVQGKPLHTWALEGRLSEIEIPTKQSTIHSLSLLSLETQPTEWILKNVLQKIETIPKVTDVRKELGRDFRRDEVRASWQSLSDTTLQKEFQIATFRCICSSGTYMRTLSEVIAEACGTKGLAYSIHRTSIGKYFSPFPSFGFFYKKY